MSVSFAEALLSKYSTPPSSLPSLLGSKWKMVGFDQTANQQSLEKLFAVSLTGHHVTHLGPPEQTLTHLSSFPLSRCSVIDLSDNDLDESLMETLYFFLYHMTTPTQPNDDESSSVRLLPVLSELILNRISFGSSLPSDHHPSSFSHNILPICSSLRILSLCHCQSLCLTSLISLQSLEALLLSQNGLTDLNDWAIEKKKKNRRLTRIDQNDSTRSVMTGTCRKDDQPSSATHPSFMSSTTNIPYRKDDDSPTMATTTTRQSMTSLRVLFPQLSLLDLSKNAFSNWSLLFPLLDVVCPQLQSLRLQFNFLTLSNIPSHSKVLSNLQCLHLSIYRENTTDDDHLQANPTTNDSFNSFELTPLEASAIAHACPSLRSLTIDTNEPSSSSQWMTRSLLIASIPTLRQVNKSDIREKERSEAEMFYIRRAMEAKGLERLEGGLKEAEGSEGLEPSKGSEFSIQFAVERSSDTFINLSDSNHCFPRLSELCQKHAAFFFSSSDILPPFRFTILSSSFNSLSSSNGSIGGDATLGDLRRFLGQVSFDWTVANTKEWKRQIDETIPDNLPLIQLGFPDNANIHL